MTQSDRTNDLADYGDRLEAAATRDLKGRPRRATRIALLAAAAVLVVGAGSAVAAGLFTPKQVAAGMPAGAVIFTGTHPTCVLDADGVTYHCTLASAPVPDSGGVTPPPGSVKASIMAALPGPDAVDYLGYKELLGIDGKVAGGCIGRDHAGLAWDCYIGDEAVKQEILVQDLLNQEMLGPGRG
jgi:hypothetical protein